MPATLTTRHVYISSGAKNAMYTLRQHTSSAGWHRDSYLGNLSIYPEKAEAKAREWFVRAYGEPNEACKQGLFFAGWADFELGPRGTLMEPAWVYTALEHLELTGNMPWGNSKGTKMEDLEDGTVLWWADRKEEELTNSCAAEIQARCKAIALERGLFAKREAAQAEWEEKRRLSAHVGTVGERMEFEGTVERLKSYESMYGTGWIYAIRCGNDCVVYFGNAELGGRGQRVRFSATVKKHDEYNGEKQTTVNRPTKIEIEEE